MLDSAILEVLIGLVFVYILLSLLVSQINTVIANSLNLRAEQLRKRIEDVVFDDGIQKKILAHPVVGVIRPKDNTKTPIETSKNEMETARVSRVDPKQFSKAMLNILSDPFLNLYSAIGAVKDKEEQDVLMDIANQLKANIEDPQRANAVLSQLHDTITQLEPPNRRDRRVLMKTLSPLQNSIRNYQAGNTGLLMVLDGVTQVENPAFQQAMETVLSGVGTLKEAEVAIEDWFNNKMDQTSEWYATTMQYFSLFVGLAVAVLLNVDSIHLSLTLWEDDSLRSQVAQTALAADLSEFFDEDGNLVITATEEDPGNTATATENGTPDEVSALLQSYQQSQETLDQLLELSLPMGWTYRTPESVEEIDLGNGQTTTIYDPLTDPRNLYRIFAVGVEGWGNFILSKLAGIAITAIAVAQGAPFWFDVLRRLAGQSSPSTDDKDG